jgi:hypothetical protein
MNEKKVFMDPYIKEVIYLNKFNEIAWAGIEYAQSLIDIIESVSKTKQFDEEYKRSELNRAGQMKEYAENEVEAGFPFLYRLSVIRLWSILEAAVDDLVIDNLMKRKVTYKEPFLKLRGAILEFLQMTEMEQAEYILELLKNELKSNLKPGSGRFDGLLTAIDCDGPVPEVIKKNLYELSQVRNSLIHRNSKADSRLLKNCPWLNIKVGDDIILTDKDFRKYQLTCYWYLIELSTRYEPEQEGVDALNILKDDLLSELTK